jgi:membrane protein DedA with SNARE-associated domain
MLLESACIPIPSEVTMVFGGFLVSRGDLDFFWVAMIGTIANVVGSWLAYWVGYVGGRPLINRWAGTSSFASTSSIEHTTGSSVEVSLPCSCPGSYR